MAKTKKGETLEMKLSDGFVAYRVDDFFDEKQQVYKALPSVYKEYKRVFGLTDKKLDEKLVFPSGAYSIRDGNGALVGALYYDEAYLQGFEATSEAVVPAVMEFCEKKGEDINAHVLQHSTVGNKTGFHVQDFFEFLGARMVSRQGRKGERINLK